MLTGVQISPLCIPANIKGIPHAFHMVSIIVHIRIHAASEQIQYLGRIAISKHHRKKQAHSTAPSCNVKVLIIFECALMSGVSADLSSSKIMVSGPITHWFAGPATSVQINHNTAIHISYCKCMTDQLRMKRLEFALASTLNQASAKVKYVLNISHWPTPYVYEQCNIHRMITNLIAHKLNRWCVRGKGGYSYANFVHTQCSHWLHQLVFCLVSK